MEKSHGKRWQLLNKINASYILFLYFFFLFSFSLLKHRTITYAETCSVLQCILVAFIWSDRRSFVHTWKIYTGIYTQCNAFFISLILFQCSYSWFWQALMSRDIREQTNKSNKKEGKKTQQNQQNTHGPFNAAKHVFNICTPTLGFIFVCFIQSVINCTLNASKWIECTWIRAIVQTFSTF